jgi:hypothetical protein
MARPRHACRMGPMLGARAGGTSSYLPSMHARAAIGFNVETVTYKNIKVGNRAVQPASAVHGGVLRGLSISSQHAVRRPEDARPHSHQERMQGAEMLTFLPSRSSLHATQFQVWDLGGQTSIRPYWRCYYPNTQVRLRPLP